MSPRDPFSIDPEDLSVRARRGLLNRSEQRELERATEASPSLRIAYEIGRDMDSATAVRGGDDALIAAAAGAALARVRNSAPARAAKLNAAKSNVAKPTRVRRVASAAAIGFCVLAASGAAAALWRGTLSWPFVHAVVVDAPAEAVARSHAPRSKLPAQQAELGERGQTEAPAQTLLVPDVLVPAALAPVARELVPAQETETPLARARAHRGGAAELFHSANAARRGGDLARAERLYAELRAMYPDSAEGELASVSLGQLLLARADATGAEREFRRYLARGHGQLMEEALVGRAHSLERMGRAREERENLRRLLADFPRSVYAAQARARLEALERGASTTPR